jgi:hypothetical protein
MSKLLPDNFDSVLSSAVKQFWMSRTSSVFTSQEGSRASVIGGKNMDGFSILIKLVAQHCGISDDCIIIVGKKHLTIPGFFRPTKMWDAMIVYKGRLLAAFELKSQVGSFGNNFNNRTEESIGSAKDFWTAHRERAFEFSNYLRDEGISLDASPEIRPPFLGYLMLLEECEDSTSPVKLEEHHFKVFPEFIKTSYAKRYQLLCEKLVFEGLYSSASLILSNRETGKSDGIFNSPTQALHPRSLFADFAGKLLAAIESI